MSLTERKVQESAQALLKKRYEGRAWNKQIFSALEVRTKKKYGGKRADGLLVFKHILYGEFVVSMEAKSYKTLSALKSYKDHGHLIVGALKWGLFTLIGTGGAVALYRSDDWTYKFWFPIVTFLGGAILYAFLTRNHDSHQMNDVIEQVRQYPANHQWVAISDDSYEQLKKTKQKALLVTCKYQAIGLIMVDKRKKARIEIKPRWKFNWGRGFLYFYSKEKEIRKGYIS